MGLWGQVGAYNGEEDEVDVTPALLFAQRDLRAHVDETARRWGKANNKDSQD